MAPRRKTPERATKPNRKPIPMPPTSSLLSGATHKGALHLFQSNYGQWILNYRPRLNIYIYMRVYRAKIVVFFFIAGIVEKFARNNCDAWKIIEQSVCARAASYSHSNSMRNSIKKLHSHIYAYCILFAYQYVFMEAHACRNIHQIFKHGNKNW